MRRSATSGPMKFIASSMSWFRSVVCGTGRTGRTALRNSSTMKWSRLISPRAISSDSSSSPARPGSTRFLIFRSTTWRWMLSEFSGIADLVGDAGGETGDGFELARLDLLPLPRDGAGLVAQDDDVADELFGSGQSGVLTRERGDVEIEQARLGITHHEIAVHHAAPRDDLVPVEPRKEALHVAADRLLRIETEEIAGGLVEVVDRSLRPGHDDSLAQDLEDLFKETLLLHDLQDETLDFLGLEAVEPVEESIDHAGVHEETAGGRGRTGGMGVSEWWKEESVRSCR